MIAKVDQILRQNGIVFEELMYARPASAEIPVYWIAFYGNTFQMWERLTALAPQTGFWPVNLSGSSEIVETSRAVVEPRLQIALTAKLDILQSAALAKFNRLFVGDALTYEDELVAKPSEFLHGWYGGSLPTGNNAAIKNTLALIPGESSWVAFAHLQASWWTGWCTKHHLTTAWVRHFETRYGALLSEVSHASLELVVKKPPRTNLEACILAESLQEIGLCIDTVAENFLSYQGYAAHLLGNNYWYFWFD
jgi:hypothetical protein